MATAVAFFELKTLR